MITNPVFHASTKHIEVPEKVFAGKNDLVYVSTHEKVADIFTVL